MSYGLVLDVILTLLILKQLLAVINILDSYQFYEKSASDSFRPIGQYPPVIVVIPLLREQQTIESALKYFATIDYPNLEVLVVTTEREIREMSGSAATTMEVLETLRHSYAFKWLHHPFATGSKADQLNYAIDQFDSLFPEYKPHQTYLAFYDVDSRPDPQTFIKFAKLIGQYPRGNIFQQSAAFYSNFGRLGVASRNRMVTLFLRAQAVNQTRFTMAYELPRIRNQLAYYERARSWRALIGSVTYAHCAGHGLFVRVSFAQRAKFPSGYALEDMFYGFILSYLKEPIIPIPALDNSEMPSTIDILFHQRARWFLGPLRFWDYSRYCRRHHEDPGTIRRSVLAFFGLYLTLNWALTSPVFLFLFSGLLTVAASIVRYGMVGTSSLAFSLLSVTFICVYMYSVLMIISRYTDTQKLSGKELGYTPISSSDRIWLLLTYPLVLLFHSIPAYYCIFDLVFRHGKLGGTKTEKPNPQDEEIPSQEKARISEQPQH